MTKSRPYTIREFSGDDIEPFRNLLSLFGEAFEDLATYSGAQPGDAYLRDFLSRDHIVVLAAIAANKVIGGLVAYELMKFERERSEFYIYDLAVAEPHRRKGVGTALIRELQEIASNRGAFVIFVQADQTDPPAIELYSKLGMRENVLYFDIEVPAKKSAASSD
ncbi:MAG: AAC(3)-I family aminoglycoside N-acetyltransferase [Methyloligellaceae bacterium]